MSEEKRKVGFAAMSPERQREIASMGGKAHAGHRWTVEEARAAGRLGGLARRKRRQPCPKCGFNPNGVDEMLPCKCEEQKV